MYITNYWYNTVVILSSEYNQIIMMEHFICTSDTDWDNHDFILYS